VVEIPKTRSAAYRIGDVPCPSCNREEKNTSEIPVSIPCAWCWDDALRVHRRFVKLTRFLEWQREHPGEIDDEEIPTSPESRGALTPVPPTDPDPNAKP